MKKTILGVTICLFCTISFSAPSGKTIYEQSCVMCHMNGTAKAPIAHNQALWQSRLNKALAAARKNAPGANKTELRQKALAILVTQVKKGVGFMPAGGMCKKCSDADYAAAIKFMMAKEKQ